MCRSVKRILPMLSSTPTAQQLVIKSDRELCEEACSCSWMCVFAGAWPMRCSDALISLSLALFLNSLSPGVLKLSEGKFFLGNTYTSYFSFLSHFISDWAANLCRYLDRWKNTDRMVSCHACFFVSLLFLLLGKIICNDEKSKIRKQFVIWVASPILYISHLKYFLRFFIF